MTVVTLPDISATGVLGAAGATARWIKLTPSAAGSRVGDASVGATQGSVMASGVPYELPQNAADPSDRYNLGQVKVYVASGTVSVTYGS